MPDVKIPWPEWKAVRRIGNGSFGSVYEIERKDQFGHTEKAALKIISIPKEEGDIDSLANIGYDDDSITEYYRKSLNSIINEYALMSQLKGHSNIVSVEDRIALRQENGIGWDVYIRMELLTPFGRSIRGKDVSESEVIKIGKDLLNALKICHSKNIIHRDIKPENIFVNEFGDYKLGDFGVARIMSHTTNATKTGTPYFMAPEVVNNEKYGKEADIYSLGMVMYWLLNNKRIPFAPKDRLPYAEDNDNAYRERISGKEIPDPANGSSEIKRIIRKALAYDPKVRYRSAPEMLEELVNAVDKTKGKITSDKIDRYEKNIAGRANENLNEKTKNICPESGLSNVENSKTEGRNSWEKDSRTIGSDTSLKDSSKTDSIVSTFGQTAGPNTRNTDYTGTISERTLESNIEKQYKQSANSVDYGDNQIVMIVDGTIKLVDFHGENEVFEISQTINQEKTVTVAAPANGVFYQSSANNNTFQIKRKDGFVVNIHLPEKNIHVHKKNGDLVKAGEDILTINYGRNQTSAAVLSMSLTKPESYLLYYDIDTEHWGLEQKKGTVIGKIINH